MLSSDKSRSVAADRRAIAAALFDVVDFSYQLADAGGWEDDVDNSLRRVVFLEDDEGGDSLKASFEISFLPGSIEPVQCHSILNRGGVELFSFTGEVVARRVPDFCWQSLQNKPPAVVASQASPTAAALPG